MKTFLTNWFGKIVLLYGSSWVFSCIQRDHWDQLVWLVDSLVDSLLTHSSSTVLTFWKILHYVVLSFTLQEVWQHSWPLPSKCQQDCTLQLPSCASQESLQVLSSIPRKEGVGHKIIPCWETLCWSFPWSSITPKMQSALFKDSLKYLCHLSPPPSSLTSTRFFPPLGPTTTAHQPDSLNAALLLALLPSSTLHPLPRRPSSPATFYLILKIQLKHYFLLMAAFLVLFFDGWFLL